MQSRADGSTQILVTCRWCGRAETNFSCPTCGNHELRAITVGASRTAEELGRAFPSVPVIASAGDHIKSVVPDRPAIVVATVGAEPLAPHGYAAALLLDGDSLLRRESLRSGEDGLSGSARPDRCASLPARLCVRTVNSPPLIDSHRHLHAIGGGEPSCACSDTVLIGPCPSEARTAGNACHGAGRTQRSEGHPATGDDTRRPPRQAADVKNLAILTGEGRHDAGR